MVQLKLLKLALYALGLAAMGIGASMFLLGSHMTAQFFAGLLASLGNLGGPVIDLTSPNVDSELRFYSVFWIAYGAVVFKTARALPQQMTRARWLLALFFAGGTGRLFSLATTGQPHPLFTSLMWIELAFPVLLIGLSLTVKRP